MKFNFILILSLLFSNASLQAQENPKKDSLNVAHPQNLETVVLTGQYNPQSVDQSVFEVKVIDRQEIERMAGNTLDDVLNQTLNLNVIPNAGEGRAGIQQFGFNSGYIKILVDGIPVVGDQGFGNSIDITQINLDDIKQIEIIEGAMGVQYGANAVTGVINIITKKSSKYDWKISPYLQEETVGDEYGLFDQGRHIQSISVSHNFNDHWYADLSYTRNDFKGFLDDRQGKDYFNPENGSDGMRGYQWLPKLQNDAKALVSYTDNDIRLFYKFEYFNEKTNKYANNVRLNPNNATQTLNPTASDAIFRTDRMYHHLNASGKLFQQLNFNVSASYQEQTRNKETYIYHLKSGEQSNAERFDYNTRQGFFSRGTLSNIFDTDAFDLEIGYALKFDEGTASGLASQDQTANTQTHQLDSYSLFASAEFDLTNRLSFRPGMRWINSSVFDDQYALSFSGKYQFNNGYQLRAIFGTSPKTPTFEQLYFYMVDSNHDIQGNPELTPEEGKSIFLHFKKTFHFNDYEFTYQPKLSAWYLDVKDKIDLIITNTSPLTYQYNNIDQYRTWGLAFRNKFRYHKLTAGIGISVSGQSQVLNSAEVSNDDYLYAVQVNSNLSYKIPEWGTVFSLFYKYNGPQQQFVTTIGTNGDKKTTKQEQEGYGWLNASVKKSFFDDRFELTLGGRNLLNVTNITTAANSAGGHAAGDSSLLLGYGASFFLKLQYNLNF